MTARKPLAYEVLEDRFIGVTGYAKRGDTVYAYLGPDYGLSRDDTEVTGILHVSVTHDEDGKEPFFTIPRQDLRQREQVEIDDDHVVIPHDVTAGWWYVRTEHDPGYVIVNVQEFIAGPRKGDLLVFCTDQEGSSEVWDFPEGAFIGRVPVPRRALTSRS